MSKNRFRQKAWDICIERDLNVSGPMTSLVSPKHTRNDLRKSDENESMRWNEREGASPSTNGKRDKYIGRRHYEHFPRLAWNRYRNIPSPVSLSSYVFRNFSWRCLFVFGSMSSFYPLLSLNDSIGIINTSFKNVSLPLSLSLIDLKKKVLFVCFTWRHISQYSSTLSPSRT